jgi:hypothetical protein
MDYYIVIYFTEKCQYFSIVDRFVLYLYSPIIKYNLGLIIMLHISIKEYINANYISNIKIIGKIVDIS